MRNERGAARSLDEELLLVARLLTRCAVSDQGCWVWMGARTTAGYGVLWLDSEPRYVHRLAAEVFLGMNPADGLVVRHGCDNRPCFNPDHLSVGTQKDNVRDAVLRGRMGKALTPEAVMEIKRLLARGVPRLAVAQEFAVTASTIGSIARGQTWKHIPWPEPRVEVVASQGEGYTAVFNDR